MRARLVFGMDLASNPFHFAICKHHFAICNLLSFSAAGVERESAVRCNRHHSLRRAPVRDWLKHAFAIDRSFSPTDEELQLAERLCREIIRRQLVVPALAFLEMSRPLNSLGAQAVHFLT